MLVVLTGASHANHYRSGCVGMRQAFFRLAEQEAAKVRIRKSETATQAEIERRIAVSMGWEEPTAVLPSSRSALALLLLLRHLNIYLFHRMDFWGHALIHHTPFPSHVHGAHQSHDALRGSWLLCPVACVVFIPCCILTGR